MRRLMFMLMFVLLIPGLPLLGGENILENPGFEEGIIDPWVGRGCDADVVTDPIDPESYGSYAGRAFNRSSGWHSIAQDVMGKIPKKDFKRKNCVVSMSVISKQY